MNTTTALQLLLLPVGAVAVAGFARRRDLPGPLLLVLAGLLVSFVPGVPAYEIDPELILLVFLPPLLYSSALDSSYLRLRDVRRAVGLLSVGLVLFSMFVVGLVVHWLLPGLPLAAAFALGAIVAPPDAVAAVAVARRLRLPRRLITILVGESLFNDATALTAYRVAVGAVMGQGISMLGAVSQFVLSSVGGVAVGFAIAIPLTWILARLRDPLVENTVMLLVPFAAYVAAELLHSSGVIAVVIVGLYLGHRMPRSGFGTRLISDAVWKVITFVLEAVVFALIGLQVKPIMEGLSGHSAWTLAAYALAVYAAAVVARVVWVIPGTYLPRRLSRKIRDIDPSPPWQHVGVISWAGMRGVVSLAAAFAMPAGFPERDLLLFLTFTTVVATLLVHGLTFPRVIRRLGVTADREVYEDNLAEAAAQQAAAEQALATLEELTRNGVSDVHAEVVDHLRTRAERRALHAWERLGGGTGPAGEETPSTVYRRLRREMLQAERDVLVRLRDERRIDDEVLRRVMQELDFEEATLERD
ncbi:monovalent cation:H+ antiporter, CPA1 family [Sinosporangium album]|uniref:Monovalent cation:H+ antiporter, CPA1 family n=1 Tax=Sinosporangium album TaxID=504805 RepID=A0A1G7R9S6_9ACTN|nr:Na+/H+ antiporter [Sinosporangium album]SDG06899.1 monovalent cation:H+ antiporter, CPA1 family [Sinosporangium album]